MKAPELLSPAGTLRNMRYAFAYGADAVYAGGPCLDLRKGSDNFTLDELEFAVRRANELGKRLYVALNSYAMDEDFAALPAYVKRLAAIGPHGIIVNAVAPGMVMTEMAHALPQEILDAALAETATKRLAEPGDIAHAVLFLLSDAASYVTGEVLRVAGGR